MILSSPNAVSNSEKYTRKQCYAQINFYYCCTLDTGDFILNCGVLDVFCVHIFMRIYSFFYNLQIITTAILFIGTL